jgi:uncharacterized protein YciI
MGKWTWSGVAVLLGCAALGAAQEAAPPKAKTTYLVVYRPGPSWLAGKPLAEQPLREHGRYMVELYGKGTLKFAGPFLDDSGGAMVIEADGEAEAKALVAADPAVKGAIMVADVRPWRLVDWEPYLKKK